MNTIPTYVPAFSRSFRLRCLFALVVVGVALNLEFTRRGFSDEGQKTKVAVSELPPDLAIVPRDAIGFVSVRVSDLWTSDIAKDLRERVSKEKAEELHKLEDMGLSISGIERLTCIVWSEPTNFLTVVTTTKPYSLKKLLRSIKSEGEEWKQEGNYYQTRFEGFYALNDRTFVYAGSNGLKSYVDSIEKIPKDPWPTSWRLAIDRHHVMVGINPTNLANLAKLADVPVPPAFQTLTQSKSAALVLDFGVESSAMARISFPKAEQTGDGEKAIKAGLVLAQGILNDFLEKKLDPEGEAETPHLCNLLKKLPSALGKTSVHTRETMVEASLQVKLDRATAGGMLAELSRLNEGYSTGATFGENPKDPTQSNLQQLAQAMLKYHKEHGRLPASAIYSKSGEPLLSWRVQLLPYLDREEMYKRFKLDEPWDSPHNKKLIENMPEIFNDWGRSKINKYKATKFRVFTGKGTAFEGTRGLRLSDFPDGPGTTFLIVQAQMPVPWTKPDLLPYLPNRPLCKLGGNREEEGFYAACADGRVHFIKAEADEKTIRALITRNGGEKVRLPDEP
jgi:hypothetical protein